MPDPITMSAHERAVRGAQERWNPKIPKATHTGILKIVDNHLECDVLEDGRRVFRQKTFLNTLARGKIGGVDRKRAESTNLPVFLTASNLTPYLGKEFYERATLIHYKDVSGKRLKGYDAALLPEVCKIYAKAEDAGALRNNQTNIAKICKVLVYGFATIGIFSLIDEATGYQEIRARNELEIILEKYICEEFRKWSSQFPNEFFRQIYRLHGWDWPKVKKNHPQYVSKIINKYVYEKLPPGVIENLKEKNPKNEHGNRKYKLHQFLTENIGIDNLNKQITLATTIMRASKNVEEFKELMNRL